MKRMGNSGGENEGVAVRDKDMEGVATDDGDICANMIININSNEGDYSKVILYPDERDRNNEDFGQIGIKNYRTEGGGDNRDKAVR